MRDFFDELGNTGAGWASKDVDEILEPFKGSQHVKSTARIAVPA
jgi:hypothetical protein